MKPLVFLVILLMLVFSCGGDEETNVEHFPNSDVYPLYSMSGAKDPSWSPDGNKIVFTYMFDLWTISPDGGDATQITTITGTELCPNWSPVAGSNKLVFINSTGPEDFTIYTLIPGGEPQAVKSFTSRISSTSWSSDEKKIIFLQSEKNAIFTIPADGGDVSQISNSQGWESILLFAQAGKVHNNIYYIDMEEFNYRINKIDIGGGEPNNIITFTASGGSSAMAPNSIDESYDGSMIAFIAALWHGVPNETDFSLLLVSPTGGETTTVTPGLARMQNNPSWSPDGKMIAMQTSAGIYIVELKL
ncbi:hypothetical protein ACFLT7_08190 [candidate division KSB1 bacterium]